MQPEDFARMWQELHADSALADEFKLIGSRSKVLQQRDLPESTKAFLRQAGLPKSAAPFSSFDRALDLPRVYEVFGVKSDWKKPDKERLSRYCMIGNDGSGNPYCLDEQNKGSVVLLNHETWFRNVWFVNSGVPELAESLLAYGRMIRETNRRNGDGAWLDGKIPPELSRELVGKLRKIDPQTMMDGCFWKMETDALPK